MRRSIEHFTTRRLVAERLGGKHLDDLLRMDKDPRILDPLGGVRTDEETQAYFDRNVQHWKEHGFGVWMLRLRRDDYFVGRAYLRHFHVNGNDEIAIGYALLPEHWGKGLATEIAAAIVDIAFARLGIESVVAGARPDNAASRRVLEKVGMAYETDTFYKDAPHVLYRISPSNVEIRPSQIDE